MYAFEREQSTQQATLIAEARLRACSLVTDVIADLDPAWGGGAMSAVAYDTAWVAMVRHPADQQQLAFPEALRWLVAHQSPDGSWGAQVPHTVLPTMAGLLALLKAPAAWQTPQIRDGAQRAESYLRQALLQWSVGQHESVGFEVLAPRLLEELAACGVLFTLPAIDTLMQLYMEKFAIAGPQLIYSGQSNLIHSLEAFGPHLDFAALKGLQAPNGSYGCSPAATAAVLIYGPSWDQAAADWLAHLSQPASSPGGMPNAYPIDAFEASWVLYNFMWGGLRQGLPAQDVGRLTDWLEGCTRADGASITRHIGMPTDSDDTGMVLAALNHAGVSAPLDTLLPFERDGHFACFARERGISLSANAHVLAACMSLPPDQRRQLLPQIRKVLGFLDSVRDPAGFWSDKWHQSPLYTTACIIMALEGDEATATTARWHPTIRWVLELQSPHDGGWSAQGASTLEETAYALQILLSLPRTLQDDYGLGYSDAIERGMSYLMQQIEGTSYADYPFPPLWRGKELYAPPRVIWSAALAVLHRYAQVRSA